jgi:hypothetical protein
MSLAEPQKLETGKSRGSTANGTAIRSPRRAGEQWQRHYIIAQWLCRFEVYHFEPLLAAADHRATEFV